MQLLLDTHVAIWALANDRRLTSSARALILDSANSISVSAVSVWEVAIKHALGRGDMPISGAQALAYFRRAGYQLVDVTPEHAAAVEGLPAIHADPFDRLLVAQALHEPMRLVTHDQMVAAYSSSIIRI
jgi:PIN domain nuclease of toxin-antitoxin system